MTIQEFFDKHNNQPLDFDGFYGDQCMDLFEFYNQDVIGAPRVWGNAIDVPNTFPSAFYSWVANSPTNVPQLGDVIIWGNPYGKYLDTSGRVSYAGHIAVFKEGDPNTFRSFDQNWPVNSNCHFQDHDYTGVLGWLHPLASPKPTVQVESATFENLVNNSTKYDAMKAAGYSSIEDIIKKVGDLTNDNGNLKTEISQISKADADLLENYKKKFEEDATAIDLGLKAEDDLKQATQTLSLVAQLLGTPPEQMAMLNAIHDLQKPIEEQLAPVVAQHETLFKILFEEGLAIYKKAPVKTKSLIEKLTQKFKEVISSWH